MDKKELKALPQSAFKPEQSHSSGCGECGAETDTGNQRHTSYNVPGQATICEACYAAHPAEAEPVRRFAISESGRQLWTDQRWHHANGGHGDSKIGNIEAAICTPRYDREIPEPEARAWAKQHGHYAAIFGEEPEEWPKWAVYTDEPCSGTVVRYGSPERGQRVGHSGLVCKDSDGWDWHVEHLNYYVVTEPAARTYAAKHNIPWPSEWGEPTAAEPTNAFPRWFAIKDQYVCRYEGESSEKNRVAHVGGGTGRTMVTLSGRMRLPEYREITRADADRITADWPREARVYLGLEEEKPAPSSPQPVGYSCRECGLLLVEYGDGSGYGCPRCEGDEHDCAVWDRGEPKPPWVQPGPLPGPWQETHEWTGEYRQAAGDEWWVDPNVGLKAVRWPLELGTSSAAAHHILRPKPKPAEAGGMLVPPKYEKQIMQIIDDLDQPTSGKDSTMQATIAKFHSRPTCPKCRARENAKTAYRLGEDGMLHNTCIGCRVAIIMPTADAGVERHDRGSVAKTIGKALVVWPVATTAKLALGFVRWAGFAGTLATAAGVTVAIRNPERAEMAVRWLWGMLG